MGWTRWTQLKARTIHEKLPLYTQEYPITMSVWNRPMSMLAVYYFVWTHCSSGFLRTRTLIDSFFPKIRKEGLLHLNEVVLSRKFLYWKKVLSALLIYFHGSRWYSSTINKSTHSWYINTIQKWAAYRIHDHTLSDCF